MPQVVTRRASDEGGREGEGRMGFAGLRVAAIVLLLSLVFGKLD